MRVSNIHRRALNVRPDAAGALLETLSSNDDRLWPKNLWPPMRLDRGLDVGSHGGHGPIRYEVVDHRPYRSVVFKFTGPAGFDGIHRFSIDACPGGTSVLTHEIDMTARRMARITWPLVFRPLHDALIEDALTRAEISLGLPQTKAAWSSWVIVLRRLLAGRRARTQNARAT